MLAHLTEVLSSICVAACSQPLEREYQLYRGVYIKATYLVILRRPFLRVGRFFQPRLILGYRKEVLALITFCNLTKVLATLVTTLTNRSPERWASQTRREIQGLSVAMGRSDLGSL